MPRVEAHIRYEAPVRMGTLLRIGIDPRIEHPRRMRHQFEIVDDAASRRVAAGFVRVGCVRLADFSPRDFPQTCTRSWSASTRSPQRRRAMTPGCHGR